MSQNPALLNIGHISSVIFLFLFLVRVHSVPNLMVREIRFVSARLQTRFDKIVSGQFIQKNRVLSRLGKRWYFGAACIYCWGPDNFIRSGLSPRNQIYVCYHTFVAFEIVDSHHFVVCYTHTDIYRSQRILSLVSYFDLFFFPFSVGIKDQSESYIVLCTEFFFKF